MSILKNVWGETIKKISVFLVLAMAFFFAPAMADNAMGGENIDLLHNGIFETNGNAFSFPVADLNTNYDSLQVGNDKATSFGMGCSFPFGFCNGPANAENNLEIKKNQNADSDTSFKLNIEQIKVGDRVAQAFGFATANNNVKILVNQE
jgi:hypothetical protein